MYQPGQVSRINTAISILPEFEGNISFCWRSKSGVLVKPSDEVFDEADLECWVEGLQPELYWQELNRVSTNHPLKLKNLPYELVVRGLGTHMHLDILLSTSNNADSIVEALSSEVEKHNQNSERNNREEGVVHNCRAEVNEMSVTFHIDLGSADIPFLKKLLRKLSKFSTVIRVIADL